MKETIPWYKIRNVLGTSLTVQRLEEYHDSTARDQGSIPGQGPKIPHATWHSQGEKKKGVLSTKTSVLWGQFYRLYFC